MNKFHFFLACAGISIAIMAVCSNEIHTFVPGVILATSVLVNVAKTKRNAVETYSMTIIACAFLLNITRENIAHYGHITDTGIMFLFSAVLTFLFGALPLWLRNHEHEINP